MAKPKAIPEGYSTVTAALCFKDTAKAIDFYKKALGAEQREIMPGPDGKGIAHAEIKIGNSIVMLSDEMPNSKSAQTLGDTPVAFYLYVEDVDSVFNRAVAAGGKVTMPIMDMFWGDRCGQFQDPYGYRWTIASKVRDVTREEIDRGQREWAAKMASGKPA